MFLFCFVLHLHVQILVTVGFPGDHIVYTVICHELFVLGAHKSALVALVRKERVVVES